jgi:branched-chain amino acid transport system permease protein
VLGGSGSVSGVILATIALTLLPELLRNREILAYVPVVWQELLGSPEMRMIIYSLVLIVMMMIRPEGLLGSRELWWTRRRRALVTSGAELKEQLP